MGSTRLRRAMLSSSSMVCIGGCGLPGPDTKVITVVMSEVKCERPVSSNLTILSASADNAMPALKF